MSCGNLTNISYPFWLRNDNYANKPFVCCGYQHFMLTCQNNNTAILVLDGYNYSVSHIDYKAHVVSVVDVEMLEPSSCPKVHHNSTLQPETEFSFSPNDTNLTFFFNCTGVSAELDMYQIQSCFGGKNGSTQKSYVHSEYINIPYNPSALKENCSEIVVTPVRHDMVNNMSTLAREYEKMLQRGFELNWPLFGHGNCGTCERSGGRCGFNWTTHSTYVFACFCEDGITAIKDCRKAVSKVVRKRTIIEVVLGLVGSCVIFLILYLLHMRKAKSGNVSCVIMHKAKNSVTVSDQTFLNQHGAAGPKNYKYSEIKRMTKSFSDKLGEGGFGNVFKGTLRNGNAVAVKVLNEFKGNGEDFINEVASISRTSHVNIVSLQGYCSEKSKRALVYEYMPNGSLDKFIFTNKSETPTILCWNKLYEIAIGIARGLEYLHRGCNIRIVHFDIKPHNILVDKDFRPKISDFGLAKLCPQQESVISMVAARGTAGYIAPEVFSRNFGVVSTKSDVYSYGMMVLEMVGGRKNIDATADNSSEIYFPHWIHDHIDFYCQSKIAEVTSEKEEKAKKMIIVSLWCIQTMPEKRPSMSMVVSMLEGRIEDLKMPPKP